MTPRQRILAALNHQQPDRVPIDFGAHRSSGIAAIAYRKLAQGAGVAGADDPRLRPGAATGDHRRRCAATVPHRRRRVGTRVRPGRQGLGRLGIARRFALPDARLGLAPAGTGRVGHSLEHSGRVLGQDARRGDATSSKPTGRYLDGDDFDRLPEALAENMWCAVRSPPGPLVCRAGWAAALCRRGQGFAGTDRSGHRRSLRRQSAGDRAVPLPQRQLPHAHGRRPRSGQRISRSDRGDPSGEFGELSWRPSAPISTSSSSATTWGCRTDRKCRGPCTVELFMPRHARMWRRAKELADVKVMLHCCGGIRPLLPDLIEAGLDAVNPVQVTCAGMDAARA